MSEPTPIPAEERASEEAIAAVAKALSRFEQPPYGDLQCSATRAAIVAIEAAAPILLAAGRTAAAAEIRAEIVDGQMPTLQAMNAAFEHAARIAENGDNR